MSKIFSIAPGFQYSINIGFDLNDNDKLKNFIPTQAAFSLLEEILLSTALNSTERSRILIGAYGRGKSHIVLMIMSILMKRELTLFSKMMPKLAANHRLFQLVRNYYDGNKKILPVIISGSSTNLTQSFLLALQRTLAENHLLHTMPETNYHAAISVIERWKVDFPEVYAKFTNMIQESAAVFIEKLSDYDIETYRTFERIYPLLTAGSAFNPFLGFDVAEIYESVSKSIEKYGYKGIYVVYDEFSKYLESNIEEASINDIKMLQDFAERCNRSAKTQLHLMLISHKEISNYIDKLPKQKVDGWRGVSERFKYVRLSDNFSQTYEIISDVIQKDPILWEAFKQKNKRQLENIEEKYKNHILFLPNHDVLKTVILGCYPLHPVSTFILPRLSESIAQNERTLFTFLSAEGHSTLKSFLSHYDDKTVEFLTPDIIYDYFEPLFRKEIYNKEIYDEYRLTNTILSTLLPDSLESKIVKTICLIYMLGQYEKIKPTKDEIVGIYSSAYEVPTINQTIDQLIADDLVIYLRQSNNYLRLKKSSGIDINEKIRDYIESHKQKVQTKKILNSINIDSYMYPSEYNDEREMTRYFSFMFIDGEEVSDDTNWTVKSEKISADGVIFAIIPQSKEAIPSIRQKIIKTSKGSQQQIFILPQNYSDIREIAQKYDAVCALKDAAMDDPILFDEYDVIYEDLLEVLQSFLSSYIRPDQHRIEYFYDGKQKTIKRKSMLTKLMSDICESVYSLTPVIVNEAVNRNTVTSIANNSRKKLISGLLRYPLEPGLGLSGNGQEIAILRSTLIRTGILGDPDGKPYINLYPADAKMAHVLSVIEEFIREAKTADGSNLEVLYQKLVSPEYHIGLRKGLIPIYLAVVLHQYKKQVIMMDKNGQVTISADLLVQVNAIPHTFRLRYIEWNSERGRFIQELSDLFSSNITRDGKEENDYVSVVSAMKRWAMSLPQVSKNSKILPDGEKIDNQYIQMMRGIYENGNEYEFLFQKLPHILGVTETNYKELVKKVGEAKSLYDAILGKLISLLKIETKDIFIQSSNGILKSKMSLSSVIKDWCDSIDPMAFDHIFQDGANRCLDLFRHITNDENSFIEKLARVVTGLRIEDWNYSMIEQYKNTLLEYKSSIEGFKKTNNEVIESSSNDYQVVFIQPNGTAIKRIFARVDTSRRGKLLYNQITKAIEAMGQAIPEKEKRQILMDVLQKLC